MKSDRLLSDLIEGQMIIRDSNSIEQQNPLECAISQIYSYCVAHSQKLTFIASQHIKSHKDHTQKLAFIQLIIAHFLQGTKDQKQGLSCSQCINYQSYLQKLQNDIRQHIRLEHQLKLYQESLEQKIEEMKKQGKERMEILEQLKQQIQQYKCQTSKIELETDRTRLQRNKSEHQFAKMERTQSMRKSMKHFYQQGKQNVSHKNRSLSKQPRKSVQKKSEKQKFKSLLSNKSNKQNPLTEKTIHKNRQDKKKAIQAKFVL